MKLVLDSIVPPEGPGWEPMDCSSRQGMEPVFGQAGTEPAGMLFECSTCAQTLLVSNELCHVALPKGSGFGAASLGLAFGLRKWVAIWTTCPKTRWKRVASGREGFTVQEAVAAPVLVGRQMYPCVPAAGATRKREWPFGGVMMAGVTGAVRVWPWAEPMALARTRPAKKRRARVM